MNVRVRVSECVGECVGVNMFECVWVVVESGFVHTALRVCACVHMCWGECVYVHRNG